MEVCYVCQDPVDDGDQLWVVALEGSLRSQVLDDIIQQRVYLSLLMNEEDDQERNGEQWQLLLLECSNLKAEYVQYVCMCHETQYTNYVWF